MSKVLVIGDLHEGATKPGYMQFCQDIYDAWNCNKVVFIGDLVDWHSISFHAREPQAPGSHDEFQIAYHCIQRWYNAFPNAKVCIGNHDERPARLAKTVNIPDFMITPYADLWGTEGWDWEYNHIIDDVYYLHGTGYSGVHPAWNAMGGLHMSVVMGHLHARAGVKWAVSPTSRLFGMDVGCGVEENAYQFAYSKHLRNKPIISCGVVIDGMPYLEVMPLEKYK